MGLWTCSKHGLYGGTQFCPTCGEGGNYVQLEQMHVQSTDPIGTAQERELINYLCRSTASAEEEQAADSLQSRIAEVEALTDLRNIVLCAEDDVTVKHLRDLLGWQKSAALSQHRKL